MATTNQRIRNTRSATLLTLLIVVAVLYMARTILMPLALAILFAFLLAPMVSRLRAWGWGPVPSAVTIVALTFIVLGFIGTGFMAQLSDLGHKLPGYEQNVHTKLDRLRQSGGSFISHATAVLQNLREEFTPKNPPPAGDQIGGQKPVPVVIQPPSPLEAIPRILGSVVDLLLMAAIVLVFTIFILIERDDLRDRLMGLAGARRVNTTTKLLDEASQRMSRYLLAQAVVNLVFGLLAGLALMLIHVPNPLLWAMLAALLRYIPYVGIWIAAAMPALVAFAIDPGYTRAPLILGVYFGIDVLLANLFEPLLYGSSTGISSLAIVVAAVFWTWLWGPVGLLLATPLTVCAATLGRYVPDLAFLNVLLCDQPVLPPATRFYQRLLAMDTEEATEIGAAFLQDHSLEDLYDTVIVPALSMAEEDRLRGKLDAAGEQFILQNTRLLVEDFAERDSATGLEEPRRAAGPHRQRWEGFQVVCIPAEDEADQIAALMLAQLLNRHGVRAKSLAEAPLVNGSLEEVAREHPKVACVSAIPPSGYTHVRYWCRRLRAQFADLKLVGALLTEQDVDEIRHRQPPIPADEIGSSLKQALAEVLALLPVETAMPETLAAAS